MIEKLTAEGLAGLIIDWLARGTHVSSVRGRDPASGNLQARRAAASASNGMGLGRRDCPAADLTPWGLTLMTASPTHAVAAGPTPSVANAAPTVLLVNAD